MTAEEILRYLAKAKSASRQPLLSPEQLPMKELRKIKPARIYVMKQCKSIGLARTIHEATIVLEGVAFSVHRRRGGLELHLRYQCHSWVRHRRTFLANCHDLAVVWPSGRVAEAGQFCFACRRSDRRPGYVVIVRSSSSVAQILSIKMQNVCFASAQRKKLHLTMT